MTKTHILFYVITVVFNFSSLTVYAQDNSKQFSTLPEFVSAVEKHYQGALDDLKKIAAEAQKNMKPKDKVELDAENKKKLSTGQAKVAALLKDPKIADHFKRHQFRELSKIKIGMNKSEIIAQFKSEDDGPSETRKYNTMLIVRPAFSDALLARLPDGGMINLSVNFIFTDDGKLKRVFTDEILDEKLNQQTWYVQ